MSLNRILQELEDERIKALQLYPGRVSRAATIMDPSTCADSEACLARLQWSEAEYVDLLTRFDLPRDIDIQRFWLRDAPPEKVREVCAAFMSLLHQTLAQTEDFDNRFLSNEMRERRANAHMSSQQSV